ncbi:uncharacterized protein LOC130744305 [Lotus japonicus]|uniref:uncharacterized protein LOC130744305 n=1 Tax=Lotus japonicus TaxID=34305 RepID=UPI0025846142|nr:uncharacterized protein LOC130744305 [Lotus japonicus]
MEVYLPEKGFSCQEVLDLIAVAGLMKTVSGFGRCFDKLVKKFVVNITLDCNMAGSAEYRKMYARGKPVNFSPISINSFMGVDVGDISLNVITKEITAGHVKSWPKKGIMSTGALSVKYALLNRIGAANWFLTNHSSHISTGLAQLIYLIGTKTPFYFGAFVFEQTMKHADTLPMKLPIDFPSLISEIILSQHPEIVASDEHPLQKAIPLTFDPGLYVGPHVQDIIVETDQVGAENFSVSISFADPGDVLSELMEVSKTLQDTIVSCTQRKKKVDLLIKRLTMGKAPAAEDRNQAGVVQDVGASSSDSS